MDSNKWSRTNQLPFPTPENLLKLSANGVEGLAYSFYRNVEVDSENDYGQLTLELVMLLLKQISDKMSPEQTLEDFLGDCQ